MARQDSSALLTSTRPAANQIRVTGDYTAIPVYIGVLFTFYCKLSNIYLRSDLLNAETRGRTTAETRGRTTLRYLEVRYTDTTEFTVTVTPVGTAAKTYSRTSTTPASGTLRIPVHARNEQVTIEINSATCGPVFISGFDWYATVTLRGKPQ